VSTTTVDVSSRVSVRALVENATVLGDVTGVIHAAGVSPSQASPATILAVDLYGTALVLEEFGSVIAPGGSCVVIASQSGHRLPALTAEQNAALATTPADQLLALPMLQPDRVTDPLNAYQISKRGNSLRVMAEAVRWGKRGARVNTISPGIIFTPLARDELTGPRGKGYRRMIEVSPAGRGGRTADGRSRRIADVADRAVGRLNWADCRRRLNGGNARDSGRSSAAMKDLHPPEAGIRKTLSVGCRRRIVEVVVYSTRKRRCVREQRLFSPATAKWRVPPIWRGSARRLACVGHISSLPATAMTCPLSAATPSPGPLSKPLTTTFAPWRASFSAIARPMPRPEPKTSATLPARLLMNVP